MDMVFVFASKLFCETQKRNFCLASQNFAKTNFCFDKFEKILEGKGCRNLDQWSLKTVLASFGMPKENNMVSIAWKDFF